MAEITLETVIQHFARLERKQRWWKRLVIATTALLGLLMSLVIVFFLRTIDAKSATVANVLQAKRFVLVDEGGKFRADLAVKDGLVGLQIYDPNGESRISLMFMDGIGPWLSLTAHDGKGKAHLTVLAHTPSLDFEDSAGHPRVQLSLDVKEGPGLLLGDEDGHRRAALALGTTGAPFLSLYDKPETSQRSRVTLEPLSQLGPTRAVLGYTALENTRTGAVEQRPTSSLVLFDTAGKVLWSTP